MAISLKPHETMLGVRVTKELRRRVKAYVAMRDTSVEVLVNKFLEETVSTGQSNKNNAPVEA
jgi:hypothetical protein